MSLDLKQLAALVKIDSLTDTLESLNTWLSDKPALRNLLISCGVIGLIFVIHRSYGKLYHWYYRLPPGLYGIPYFGSLFTSIAYHTDFHSKLLPQYGPIATYNIGTKQFITLNDTQLIYSVLKHESCRNRPAWLRDFFDRAKCKYPIGAANENEYWSLRRKNIVNGIAAIAKRDGIVANVHHLCDNFLYKEIEAVINEKNGIWYISEDVRNTSFNIVFGGIFGASHQMRKDNPDYQSINENFGIFLKNVFVAALFEFVPLGGLSPLLFSGIYKTIQNSVINVTQTIEKIEKQAEIRYKNDNNQNSSNTEMQDMDKTEYSLYDELYTNVIKDDFYTHDMLIRDVWGMLSASIDTAGTVMEAGLLYAAKYPKLQEDIYQELLACAIKDDKQLQNNEPKRLRFDLKDLAKCVKFRAFVDETLRVVMPSDKGVPRELTKNCVLSFDKNSDDECINVDFEPISIATKENRLYPTNKQFSYVISTDMIIEPNLAHASKPSQFNINNWISEKDGKLKYVHNIHSIPFGTGVRDCPGKLLAQRELYGFLSNLLLNYQVAPAVINGETQEINVQFVQGLTKEIIPKIPVSVSKRRVV